MAQRCFPPTRWSLVLAAKANDAPSATALRTLCVVYWRPLYVFLRRDGLKVEEAEDTIQGFFATLLGGSGIAGVERERGRFRSYLMGALRHYTSRQRAQRTAHKRGGNKTIVPLDMDEIESRTPCSGDTPERAYARAWALEVLGQARARLAASYEDDGQRERYNAIEPFLGSATSLGSSPAPCYAHIATELDTSEAQVRVWVHRLRQRLGKHLRSVIGETVANEVDIDDELRAVIAAIE